MRIQRDGESSGGTAPIAIEKQAGGNFKGLLGRFSKEEIYKKKKGFFKKGLLAR